VFGAVAGLATRDAITDEIANAVIDSVDTVVAIGAVSDFLGRGTFVTDGARLSRFDAAIPTGLLSDEPKLLQRKLKWVATPFGRTLVILKEELQACFPRALLVGLSPIRQKPSADTIAAAAHDNASH
jgi:hypothetical protein